MVPLVDLSRRCAPYADEFAARVAAIMERGRFLLDEETAGFEHEFAGWCGASHAVAVSSGAAALQLALAAAGVGPGDEVIVPAFTAVPTVSAVVALGAIPVPVDVEPATATLDPALVAQERTARTRAVVVVHLYGREARVPATDLAVVEDAAQAHGAVTDHTRSAAVAYSFYPTKNLGGIGDGGAVVTADPSIAERVRTLRTHGMDAGYSHGVASQNFRMSEIEAAWLRLALTGLRAGNIRRREIAAAYRLAAPGLGWQADAPTHVHHLCVARPADRERFRAAMASGGVATAVHYPLAVTQQPAYRRFVRRACPIAEEWAARCVSLPCAPELTDAEVELVAAVLAGSGER